MKKFLAAIDGLKFSESTARYAARLAKEANAHLVGVFLEDFTYHSYKIYELVGHQGEMDEKIDQLEERDKEEREKAVHVFEQICREVGLNYAVHRNRSIALQELLHESIYADLLIIDCKETLTHYEEGIPTRFIRDLLEQVQCPVLAVPSKYKPIEKVMLLYDGSPSSVFAIRSFSYVMDHLKNLDPEVITVNRMKGSLHVPDNRLVKEFMKRHFPKTGFVVLKGDAETEIVNYIREQDQQPVIVLGAYRRGTVSRWFKPSMADVLMQELKVPLFIAHNK